MACENFRYRHYRANYLCLDFCFPSLGSLSYLCPVPSMFRISVIHPARQYASLRLTNEYMYGLPGTAKDANVHVLAVKVCACEARHVHVYTNVRVVMLAAGRHRERRGGKMKKSQVVSLAHGQASVQSYCQTIQLFGPTTLLTPIEYSKCN
jgi:hypothetical protein